MIVAKTKMKKIPETYKECCFAIEEISEYYNAKFIVCSITKETCDYTKFRKNCPLIEVEV